MMIPQVLKNEKIRFCKIRANTKKPYEKDWTNKPYSYEEMDDWLRNNQENYGILCGYGDLAVIDSDNPTFQVAIESIFPKTFRIKTGSGGVHNYFFIPDLKQKIILNLEDDEKTHLGEVQSYGTQVVGAGSIHPNGNRYEILEDMPITPLSCTELLDKLKPFMKKEIEKTEANAQWENMRTTSENPIDSLSVMDIWGTAGMKKQGSEYYGAHPLHGSSGGMNFWINPMKNTWHCFRCNSGGGVLSAIAVREGIIDCIEAQRGGLRGDNARKCIEIAKDKYGLKAPPMYAKIGNIGSLPGERDENGFYKDVQKNYQTPTTSIEIIWGNTLKDYEVKEKKWIVDKLIPDKSICILTGDRGTMKTFVSLLFCINIATGNNFLNTFQTEKSKVIYIDKENGVSEIKKRMSMIAQGLRIKESDLENLGFICFSQLKLDRLPDMTALENTIKEQKPKLLIVDTYRRAISYDENDAGEVSKLFVDTLRPLIEKYDFSILMIHHNRKKSNQKEDVEEDEMDMMRGSSDLANYADIILKLEKKGDVLVLKQLKNRNAMEEKPIAIKYHFPEFENVCHFNCMGEFIKRTIPEKCAEALLVWIGKENLKSFKRADALLVAENKGFKKTNFDNSLAILCDRGLIEKTDMGLYKVISA